MKLPFGLRWWELWPEALLVAGLGLFFVTETSAASSAFRSPTAILLMLATALVWIAARIAFARWVHLPGLQMGVFGLAALAVLAVVVLPAYRDTTVVETFPTAAGAGPPTTTAPSTTTSTAPPTTPPPEALPEEPTSTTTPPTTAPTTTTPPTTAPPATEPVALRSADLYGIDHRASGTVVIYQQPNGTFVVGLEGIDIQPGPDYDLYLVPGGDRSDPGGGVRLDDLRGNRGTQYYDVPAGPDLDVSQWTVLVWCETFDVPVAAATP
jgi:hypothetical protein